MLRTPELTSASMVASNEGETHMKILVPLVSCVAILSMSSVELASAQNLDDVLQNLQARVKQLESQSGVGQLPAGVIVMWSGAINDIPEGWVLCDGTSGTPNLSDRFVMGTVTTDPSASRLGGGEVVLSGKNLPLHRHSIQHGHGHTFGVAPDSHGHRDTRTRTEIVGSQYESNTLKAGKDRGLYTGDSVPTKDTRLSIRGDVNDFIGNSSSSGEEAPVPVKIVPSFYKLAFIMKVNE